MADPSASSAVRLGADLSDLLSGLEQGDLGAIVESALERIAREVDADIAFAALLDADQVDDAWEWTGPGVSNSDPPRRGQSPAEAFGAALAFLDADEPCPIADLSQVGLGEDDRRRFSESGAEALLLVPVCSHGHLVGVTGFLTVGRTREWTRRDTDVLRAFSRVLVTAALRTRSGASAAAARIRATRIAAVIPEALVTTTTDGDITWASPRAVQLLERDWMSLIGSPLPSLAPGFEIDLKQVVADAVSTSEVRDVAVQIESQNRGSIWCELTATLAGDGPSDPTAELLVVIRDVDRRRKALAELEHAASHDSLTGALNRWGMRAAFDATMSTARPVFLALVDVDRFKQINDEHGHLVGDRVLIDLVAALRSLAGDDGLVARLGGDEFVLMSPSVLSAARAESLCRDMSSHLRIPIDADTHATVSVGAVLSAHPSDLSDLLAFADRAVYGAKAAGRDSWLLEQLPAPR